MVSEIKIIEKEYSKSQARYIFDYGIITGIGLSIMIISLYFKY
jgi:hypothetical protein